MRKIRNGYRARIIGGFFCVCLTMASCLRAGAAETGMYAAPGGQMTAGTGMYAAPVAEMVEEPQLYATSAVLMDADSGRVLYEKNGYSPMAMASTTKIMTCILVLERGDLDDLAEVSAYAASMPKVKLYVRQGEQYKVRDLLFSLMLESHNDSAVVLAEYIGRQFLPKELKDKSVSEYTAEESRQAVKAFALLMNQKARELGCVQTWFVTPNGLDATETVQLKSGETLQKEHSTTAAELAAIMAYCIKRSPVKEQFLEITRTQSYSFTENGRSFSCYNHNAFLNMMAGALCGKTGFTNKAGYCYVGALERDGKTFIVALLACGWPNNKSYKWSDTRELMNYGLENYSYREFLSAENAYDERKLVPLSVTNGQTKVLGEVARVGVKIRERTGEGPEDKKLEGSSRSGLLMRADEKIDVDCRIQESLRAPVKAGTVVGSIRYSVDGQEYFAEEIVTTQDIHKIDLPWCVRQIWSRFLIG